MLVALSKINIFTYLFIISVIIYVVIEYCVGFAAVLAGKHLVLV
jgi:hypothetical protein